MSLCKLRKCTLVFVHLIYFPYAIDKHQYMYQVFVAPTLLLLQLYDYKDFEQFIVLNIYL